MLLRRLPVCRRLRATGDVLIDQLVQMAAAALTCAVLAEGLDMADAERQFDRFKAAFYQGDVTRPAAPHFRKAA